MRKLEPRPCPCPCVLHVSSGKDAGLDHECELVDCITIVMCGGTTVALPATVKRVQLSRTLASGCASDVHTYAPVHARRHARACVGGIRARAHVGRSEPSPVAGVLMLVFLPMKFQIFN